MILKLSRCITHTTNMSSQPLPLPPHLNKNPTSFPDFIHFSSKSPNYLPLHLYSRRFSKFPIMPLNKNENPNFGSPRSLSEWLKPRLNSECFASWGVKPGTKNVNNLFLELSVGETVLDNSVPPVRTVEAVLLRIVRSDYKVLIESHQELSDGVFRSRGRPLSEKMKAGESVRGAVYRAVKEELGSVLGNDEVVKIVPNSYFRKVEERESLSYPGLPARYVLHKVDVTVEGLPKGEFCTEELDEYGKLDGAGVTDGAVSCRKHYWKWVDPDTIGCMGSWVGIELVMG